MTIGGPMSQENILTATTEPSESLVSWTHIIYALHATSLVIGIVGVASVVGAFLFGWPSIIAVILNYIKRSEARGTFLDSHFRWQIRTFWFAALWCSIGLALFLTLVGIPIAFGIWVATGIWVAYRVIRGWIALLKGKPLALPA